MIRIGQIKISCGISRKDHKKILIKKASKMLNLKEGGIKELSIVKRSLDARKKPDIFWVYTVDVKVSDEADILRKIKGVSAVCTKDYDFGYNASQTTGTFKRPVIVGLGPAGLFCAYFLAKAGFKPIILERGKCVEERIKDVEAYWNSGILDTESNVQFGEGGAGTFSDGKLNTLIKDRDGRNKEVLKIFAMHGADEDILYDNKPHIGTDKLIDVVSSMRKSILSYGAEIYYEHRADSFSYKNGHICGVYAKDRFFETDNVILAVGHSARDTFEVLLKDNINLSPKAFAVGFRVMHPQDIIDENQYGIAFESEDLPVASYKLAADAQNRGVYSFCMCPGGYVVNASSETGHTAVNGMSYHDRGSKVANSAIVVQVTEEDFDGADPLSGMRFQRDIEKKAFELAKGKIPLQRYGDFKNSVDPNTGFEAVLEFEPACKGDYEYCDLSVIMPQEINESFVCGMEQFSKKIKHFNDANVIMAGVESRTSSPVRINRDENGMSNIRGLFPCGEGAGYAGGITSAAMDGIYIAEKVALRIIEGV